MFLNRKNPNESQYPTGTKTIVSVIKNEGSPELILWKVPFEDFGVHSKVIVGESEDALFYKDGIVEEVFSSGKYDLETGNYPFLSRIRNSISGGVSIYNCRIYYLNKVHKLDNRWGTDSPIQVRDKVLGISTQIRARGSYTLKVENSKKFFLKYIGATSASLTPDAVASDLKGPILQHIKSTIGQAINQMDGELLGICSRQSEVAEHMRPILEPYFEEYGLRLVNFYVEALDILDDEYRTLAETANAEAYVTMRNTMAEKARLEALGITWAQSESASILHDAAKNEGSGMVGAGVGMGVGFAAGGAMMGMAQNVLVPLQDNSQKVQNNTPKEEKPTAQNRFFENEALSSPGNNNMVTCPSCGKSVLNGKFCSECGFRLILTCPSCGNTLSPGSKFCPECGGRVL